ncbi:hypothetical protein BD309DRAFT_858521 [Dichomitus squalens]|uniref:Uncharacterized protein n=1 Tax=Dichomitus squalens TaxID=114155 RepID=A0A4V2K4Y5_9APHY|nr:hypothetical protein BD309DRAFT_858521 [Dichomitus squalens]TBU57348.1 hypothetical protein BD310DRAFT_929525 [Dichomitus squalens]
MDPLLSESFYYPPYDLEGDLPLAEDVLTWLDHLPESHHSSGASASPEPSSAAVAGPSSSSYTSSHSPEEPPTNGSGYSSSSSSAPSSGCSRQAKKSKISLDASQPLTVKGRPRTRVYVACRECRDRKVRCDGAKPVCFTCRKRHPDLTVCDYEPAPKRRGRDKVPGSRTRPGTVPRTSPGVQSSGSSDAQGQRRAKAHDSETDFEAIIQGFDPANFDPNDPASYELPPPTATNTPEHGQQVNGSKGRAPFMVRAPNMQFARETWWDALLVSYASYDTDGDLGDALGLTAKQRATTTKRIFADIRAILRASIFWASFLHLPRFFETLLDPAKRQAIQPSLLLSMLAIGAHVQSSELRQGAKGRARAQVLVEQAHAALQASLSTNWVDVGLVQAAWFLTYFEIQGHPTHGWDRCRHSIVLLDSMIRLLNLTNLDADRPEAQYSLFATYASSKDWSSGQQATVADAVHGAACTNVGADAQAHLGAQWLGIDMGGGAGPGLGAIPAGDRPGLGQGRCACARYTLKQQWPTVSEIAPLWEATTMWPDAMSEGEVRKEECRRLVWSSVMLTAGQNSYNSDAKERMHLFIKDYRNYAVLFPGEELGRLGMAPVRQNNVWNLCLRAMILWNTSVRRRSDPDIGPMERAEYALNAWLEADAIEAALDQHTCNLEGGMLFQAREFLFTTRMFISHEFRMYAPLVTSLGIMTYYRSKADLWLRTQMAVTQKIWDEAQMNPKSELINRPLLGYWFIAHILRAILLYKADPTLLIALEAAKVHIQPLEYLMRIWPCDELRQQWSTLRYQLTEFCLKAGVTPPQAAIPPPFLVAKASSSPEAATAQA